MEAQKKKKTIQFEDDIAAKKMEDKRPSIQSLPGGILKKKSPSINNESPTSKDPKPENTEPETNNDVYAPGKIPLLNLNFGEEQKPAKFNGLRLEPVEENPNGEMGKTSNFQLKRNKNIRKVPANLTEKFENLNDGLERFKKEHKMAEGEENIKKVRVQDDPDYIEQTVYKALRAGMDQLFLKRPKNPINFLGVFLLEYEK